MYDGNNNVGLTINNGYSINFNSFGDNRTIMIVNYKNIMVYQSFSVPAIVASGAVDIGTSYSPGISFRCRMTAYFEQSVVIAGYLSCTMTPEQNTGTDYVGVVINTNQGQNYNTVLYIMYGSFTGLHRCFTNDELYNSDNHNYLKIIILVE